MTVTTLSSNLMVLLGLVLMPSGLIIKLLTGSLKSEMKLFKLEWRSMFLYFLKDFVLAFISFFIGLAIMGLGLLQMMLQLSMPLHMTGGALLMVAIGVSGLIGLHMLDGWLKLQRA